MRLRSSRTPLLAILALLAWGPGIADGQSLQLRQVGSNNTSIAVQVGQTVNINVIADLQNVESSGIAFYITVPEDAFKVVNKGIPGQLDSLRIKYVDGVRVREPVTHPFEPGPLFQGAGTVTNKLLVEDPLDTEHYDSVAADRPGQQLDYSAVIGSGANRVRTGSGVVATFSLLCIGPIEFGHVRLDDNPIRETRLYLSDGISDKRFTTVQGLDITVSGVELQGIPDVVLLPGQSDSTTIGSLDQYVRNTLSPIDSIRWSFEPADPDSLAITIDPDTRRVRIVPVEGWKGRQSILWRATEHREIIQGQPPLSAVDFSSIIVNDPPRFIALRGPDGVKRDTVWFMEDQHTFIPGTANPDNRRAFRGPDLDDLVVDPDVVDPDTELNYLGSRSEQVWGDDDPVNHQLLLWSAPNFSGTDSVLIIVQDELGSRDTLRVVVVVGEVPDAPRFIVDDRNPRISRGGSKLYRLDELVEDVDTPLDSLLLSWTDDEDEHFWADTLRVSGVLTVELHGDPTYTGTGPIRFHVADPADTLNLVDDMILYVTSSTVQPPAVFPREIKIDLGPGGAAQTEDLDDYVEDPDTDDADLTWAIPSVTRSQMGLDVNRRLSVSAPQDFVGYEGMELTVSDPADQSDNLALRIYSSDGRPVVGGIPDVALNKGDQDQQTDLDNYYYDLDNEDGAMIWKVLDTYDTNNLQVSVDYFTHIITYFAPQSAVFRTETVVFQVKDPSGISAEDTVLVTIHSDGVDPGGDFGISPLEPKQALVGQVTELWHLRDHLQTSPSVPDSTIRWEVTQTGRVGTAFTSLEGVVSVFSRDSGLDTLEFAATDTLGRIKRVSTTILYVGAGETLDLRDIPDIVFIAGNQFTDLVLNDFILDHETHPDSLIEWDHSWVSAGQVPVFLTIDPDDSSVFAISQDTTQSRVVFVARNTSSGVTGRDTVRVISRDKIDALELEPPLLDIVFQSGESDTTTILNDHLLFSHLPADFVPSRTNWSVSGQTITSPSIDPQAPHRLRVSSVGNQIGEDTLVLTVDLGGGYTATDTMAVEITEWIEESTLEMRVVPNPTNPAFLDFFVMARTELASSPTVVASFGGDTTVAVRQIEDRLQEKGVLIWAASFILPDDAMGTVLFRAQALTALGTSVDAVTSIAIGLASPGKPIALQHGPATLYLPTGSVQTETRIVLVTDAGDASASAKRAGSSGRNGLLPSDSELSKRATIDLYPLGLRLEKAAVLRLAGGYERSDGLYIHSGERWTYLAEAADAEAAITRFARYAIMRDHVAPQIGPVGRVGGEGATFEAEISDGGSGLDDANVLLALADVRVSAQIAGGQARWGLPEYVVPGQYTAVISASDRAGNESTRTVEIVVRARALPTVLELRANYPNPFNPETVIPFRVPASEGRGRFRMTIYNATGQAVRRLLDGVLEEGQHEVVWDGRDGNGRSLGSGVYLYRLESSSTALTRQMTLLK